MLYLIIIISLSTGHFLTTLSKKLIDEVLGTINFSQQPSQMLPGYFLSLKIAISISAVIWEKQDILYFLKIL